MKKILLVDDDKDFVELNKSILEKNGYNVICAYNVKEGMEKLQKENPELLILDVMMEEADDGFAMAQNIRRQGNKVPIIMLTSVGKLTGMEYGKDNEMLPVNEFFEKPVSASKLLEAVKKYLK